MNTYKHTRQVNLQITSKHTEVLTGDHRTKVLAQERTTLQSSQPNTIVRITSHKNVQYAHYLANIPRMPLKRLNMTYNKALDSNMSKTYHFVTKRLNRTRTMSLHDHFYQNEVWLNQNGCYHKKLDSPTIPWIAYTSKTDLRIKRYERLKIPKLMNSTRDATKERRDARKSSVRKTTQIWPKSRRD